MSMESLKESFDQRDASLSVFDAFSTEGDPTPVGTVDGADTSVNLTLAGAISAGVFTAGAASYTWKTYKAMQALAPKPDVWDEMLAIGKKVNLKTALERVERGGDVVKLMEILPTVGVTIKRLPISELLKEAEKAIDALDNHELAMKTAIQRMDVAQTKAWEASKAAFAVSATITGVGVVGTGIAAAYAAKSDQFMDEDSSSEVMQSKLVNDAFAEFEMRADLSLGDLDGTIEKVKAFVNDLPDIDAMVKLMASLDKIAEPLEAIFDEITGLIEPFGVFTDVVDVIATPLDPVFSFFEDPPDIIPYIKGYTTITPEICTPLGCIPAVKVPIPGLKPPFNPIPRSEVQKIIDAFNSVMETAETVFMAVFGPILKPIEDTISKFLQPLLDKLNPFDDYIDDYFIASEIISDLRDLLDTITAQFDELLNSLPDIDVNLAPIKELGVFEEGGMSMFLGQDIDEKLSGIKSSLSNSAMGGAILQGNGGNDDITGTSDNDLLGGGTGKDIIKGLAGDDVIFGDEGNDTIDGGEGSDVIIGGTGFDVAQYLSGNFDEFDIVQKGNAIEITGPDGSDVDLLTGIEEFQFKDKSVKATDLFPDIVTDPGPDIPDVVVDRIEKITGGALDDVLYSGAVRAAFMSGGGGADTFEFKEEVRNGKKEIDVVEDFELGADLVRLAEGGVAEMRQTSGGLVLILEDDGDAIYLRNEDLDLQDGNSVFELA